MRFETGQFCMPIQIKMLCRIRKATSLAWGILLVLLLCSSCGEQRESAADQNTPVQPDRFTFFDLGANSALTEKVRDSLTERLGNAAVAQRGVINLQINDDEFMAQYFPVLNELNRDLNSPSGERIEHDMIKLMYRYARKKNSPFDYVELVFSSHSRLPLIFRIDFKKDEANILQALKSKYGEPRLIAWQKNASQNLCWENGDFLIVSLVPDQFGEPEYQIRFFFVENITALLEHEKAQREKTGSQRARSGKKAF